MKNWLFILVILAAISATFANIQCYNCGGLLRKPCNNPFNGNITDKVNCSSGCLTIDGLDSENKPKQARDCGRRTTTVCEKNKEMFGLTGQLCFCTTNLCNGITGYKTHKHQFVILANLLCRFPLTATPALYTIELIFAVSLT
jgi:hypothetical protein